MVALGLLVESESQSFTKRLPIFLPLIRRCILFQKTDEGGDGQEEAKDDEKGDETDTCNGAEVGEGGEMPVDSQQLKVKEEEGEGEMDRLLFSTLGTMSKILQECDIMRTSMHASIMSEIWSKS